MDIGIMFAGGLFVGFFLEGTPMFHELVTLSCLALAVSRDEFLQSHVGLLLSAGFCFLFTCHLLIFYGIAELEPKSSTKYIPFKEVHDSDLEFENEVPVATCQQKFYVLHVFKRFHEFCKFRPFYGVMFTVGIIFLVMSCIIRIFIEKGNIQADLKMASFVLIPPGLLLSTVPLFLANAEIYIVDDEDSVYSYHPFQKNVEVPLKSVAGKALAVLVTSGFMNIIFTLFLFACVSLSVCSLVFLFHMTAEDCKEMQEKYQERFIIRKDVRWILVTLFMSAITCGLLLVANEIIVSWNKAKGSVFAIIERNWRQNVPAIEYLLPDNNVLKLEDLQTAFNLKRMQQLTNGEKRAFNYINWPLWQTKRPFFNQQIIAAERQNIECDRPIEAEPPHLENEAVGGTEPENQPLLSVAEPDLQAAIDEPVHQSPREGKDQGQQTDPPRSTHENDPATVSEFANQQPVPEDLERDQQADVIDTEHQEHAEVSSVQPTRKNAIRSCRQRKTSQSSLVQPATASRRTTRISR